MTIYTRFCRESFNEKGTLTGLELTYPGNFNYGYDVVDVLGEETPEELALMWCDHRGEEKRFTFREMACWSSRMAHALQDLGIRKGMRVMLVLKRHYTYWFAVIALHKLGVLAIPATHMLTVDDYVYRIRTARVDAVLCVDEEGLGERLGAAVAGTNCQIWPVTELLERAAVEPDHFSRVETRAEDPMLLYFTSGTTGAPKGVLHDFTYPLAHIVTARYWQRAEEGGLHFTVAETGWAKASWGKLYGQWLVGSGVMVYDFEGFDPKQLCAVINKYGVTSFCAPPTVYRYLVRKGIPDMPGLRHASTAGEMLDPLVFQAFQKQTGLTLMEGYGQTETTLLVANFGDEEPAAGSMGRPSPFYHIELVDKKGLPVPEGEVGEVVVVPRDSGRVHGVFSGYLEDDALYRKAWQGNVYHTGDAASRDGMGRLFFHGRFDDIIKTGGYRVGPDEVEQVLLTHPAVRECSVVGVPDGLRGQAIKAFIVPCSGYAPSPVLSLEIRESCNKKLAEYKWVRVVEFVEELPKTISGKTRRAQLRGAG